jgi:galactose mutarotase-like enzyme
MNHPDRNWGCRISDEHTFRGLRTLVMENELLRVCALLDQGADIYEFLYKPLDIDFMWRAPNRVQPPAFRPAGAPPNGFFQDYYHGGWQEIFPSGGLGCEHHGAALHQHGEVALSAWNCRIARDTPECVAATVSTQTYRTPFTIEKTLRLETGKAVLFMDEKITNTGTAPMEYMWGHHPAFGAPFLDASCRIDIPAARVAVHPDRVSETQRLAPGAAFDSFPMVADKDGAPLDLARVPGPDANTMEMCYLLDLEDGWYALTNTGRGAGFGMRWDRTVFPVVWLWEVFGGGHGYPWFGRTYNLALEPFTSWPGGMRNALNNGTAPILGAGESLETSLLAVAYEGFGAVSGISDAGVVSGPPRA